MRIRASLLVLGLSITVSKADDLKYNIKPKQVVPYEVLITADTPSAKETLRGVIAYTGKSAAGNVLTVEYAGGLKKTSKSKSSGGGGGRGGIRRGFGGPPRGRFGSGGPPRPRSPFDKPDYRGLTQAKNTLSISSVGEVTNMVGDSQLPYLLGNLSVLPFEALPEKERRQWETGSGLTITSGGSSNSRFGGRFGPGGPFGNSNDETRKTGGGESTKYQIQNQDGNLVRIGKTYSLSSPAKTAEETGFNMQGNGTWIFNRKLGVSESMDFNCTLTLKGSNNQTRIPLVVQFKRMEASAYEAHQKKAKEARDAAIARAKNPKKAAGMNASTKKRTMAQLQKSQWGPVWVALEGLNRSRMTGLVKQDMDLMVLVGKLRGHDNSKVKGSANKVWNKWKASFEEHATASQKRIVAAAAPEEEEMAEGADDDDNPFDVEGDDDGKGMRTWTSGRFKIEAEFQKLQGKTVILKNKKGKTVRVPMSRLSAEDKKLVEKLSK